MKRNKLRFFSGLLASTVALPAVAEGNVVAGDTTLGEVVVTGERINPLKIPVKMTVVTEAEIKAKGAQTVDEALKDVAGLYVTGSNVKGRKVAQIRGSDANSTKVIIDGVMLNGDGDARRDLSIIPTDNIERIEIFKGPVPVIYGTNAPGGVIFITTKNPSGKTSGALGLSMGSWGTETYSLSLGGSVGDVSYYFGAKKSNTDGYNDNPNHVGGYKKNTAEEAQYFNGKLVWDINPAATLTVFGSYSDTTRQLPNRYNETTRLTYPGGGSGLTAQNNYFGGGGTGSPAAATYNWAYEPIKESYLGSVYNHNLNENNDISLKVYRSELKSLLTTQGSAPLFNFQSVDWDGSTNGYELQHTIRTGKSVTVTWGYSNETRSLVEITPQDSSLTKYARGDYNYSGSSYFMQAVFNLGSQLDVSVGYRHNTVNDHLVVKNVTWTKPASHEQIGEYSSNDPVLALNFRPIENIALRASVGKSFRAPTAMERSAPLTASVVQLPLPYYGTEVLPERGLNRELGLEAATSFGLGVGITCFNRHITDMIKGAGAGGGHTQYFNIPEVEMRGFEAEVSQKVGESIKGFVNYSYTNAYDKLMGTQVSDIPRRKFSYGLNFTNNGLTANLTVNHVGPVRSMYSQGSGNGSSDGNYSNVIAGVSTYWGTRDLPGYYLVDLKINKKLGNNDYYVKVQNLLNHQYYPAAYLAAPGRYAEVGVTIRF
ncbi:TonB-dependent receptor [Ferribacterium limneticum]|uniref:TonB-dependent receptor n=1 Tax=Ferribacterium limneticum TaxID=76259 RepID=UPI001CFABBE5|nr:TonB-dependent receptor [Ferribacterium limneticum]UCV20677.1 TonB-dependent receptor [Ferribacterium limneticum]